MGVAALPKDVAWRGVFVGEADNERWRIRSYNASLREVDGVPVGVPLLPR